MLATNGDEEKLRRGINPWWRIVRKRTPTDDIPTVGTNPSSSDLIKSDGPEKPSLPSESKAEAEMERAKVFSRLAVRVPTVIKSDRADRKPVTQAETERVSHIVDAG